MWSFACDMVVLPSERGPFGLSTGGQLAGMSHAQLQRPGDNSVLLSFQSWL